MNNVETLIEVLEQDGLTFAKLEQWCKVGYRMNLNPLSVIGKYLKNYGITIPIHYIEVYGPTYWDDVLNKMCGKVVPLIVITAYKHSGCCLDVHIDLITTKHWNHEDDESKVINYL